MKTRFSSKRIATAAIGAAISLLAIIAAYYVKNLSLSFNVLAGVGLLLPLSQKYYKESVLAYVAAAALGAVFTNINVLPFVMVTGLYTIAAVLLYDKKVKWVITVPACAAYGCLCFFILYKLASLITLDIVKLKLGGLSPASLYVILNAVFLLALAAFHALIIWINNYLSKLLKKVIK
ncbi:MAG TPA: hypothetical protein PKH08_06145 [Clostridia bacterium]|jgi:hypothetical protein|nr:hypothetical protein [Clostridia bacterium]HOK81593.1 hypothetical protein [Clostridia bacterium]HOL60490.1 hypothetical protein [Clostridia bacterium]HPO52897.1 hypothetical protein [Clostridia bacterium]